jgi:uncharacterized SAM-binding protein YcdF (DUF218 family)
VTPAAAAAGGQREARAGSPRGRLLVRLLRGLVAGALVLGLLLAVAVVPLTVFPRSVAVPRDADVVVVLAGGQGERLEQALALMDRAVGPPAGLLLVSDVPDPVERPGEEVPCGTTGERYAIACFTPDPETTAGEAQAIGRLASGQDWDRVALVTTTYHATRARLRVERCTEAEVEVVTAASRRGLLDRAYRSLREVIALARDAVQGGGC